MIDPTSRTEAALLLRRLASGRITNDDFDERYPRRSPDPGVVAVGEVAWTLYSDLRTYRLVGSKALSSADRRLVARCVLFLHSGLPYSWLPFRKTPFLSGVRRLFRAKRHVTEDAPLRAPNRYVPPISWGGIAVLALILLVVMGLEYCSARRPGATTEGVECVQQYSRAKTAGDTLAIDERLPFIGSAKQPYAPTCGTLRKSGELRRRR